MLASLAMRVWPSAERHGDKRIIAAAGSDRVELVFPALETLLEVVDDILHRFFLRALVGEAEGTIAISQNMM